MQIEKNFLKFGRIFEIIFTLENLSRKITVKDKIITVWWEEGPMSRKSVFESGEGIHVEWKMEANGSGICVKEFEVDEKPINRVVGEHVFFNPTRISIENFS